jgi:UPF0755 protein
LRAEEFKGRKRIMSDDHSQSQPPRNPAPLRAEQRPILQPRSPRQALIPDQVPPPPSARARHPLVIIGNTIFTGLLLLILAGGATLYFGKRKLEAPGPLERERSVLIENKKGLRDIADLLKREGVIDNTLPFIAGAMVLGVKEDLKAGEYMFERQASMLDVLKTIVEGRSIQYTVTIPEGLTSEQIVQRLRDSNVLTGEITAVPPEGTLLPETYKVTRAMTREQIIQRMQASHKRLLNEVWEKRSPDIPVKSPQELVILASIVEKETGKTDERSRVAGVFVNRLNKRMRLQSDPTIVYGLMGGKGPLGRPLLRVEMDEPNPYNTYQIEGLPPGPIANPGRASLEATAHPARTKDLYFVADGTGGHVFAESLDQHSKNVARWREVEKQDTNPAQPPPAASPVHAAQPVQEPAQAPQVQQAPAASKLAAPVTSPRTVIAPKKKQTQKKSDSKKDAKTDAKNQATSQAPGQIPRPQ